MDPSTIKQIRGDLEAGRIEAATSACREALEADPGDLAAAQLLADCAFESGRPDTARALLEKVIAAAPDNPSAHGDLALVLHALGQPVDAVPHLRRALELDPDDPELLNNLGGMLEEVGQHAEAERHYRRSVELDPASAVAWLNLAGLLRKRSAHDEAIDGLRRAATLDPELGMAWEALGQALFDTRRFDEAIGPLRRGAALLPRSQVVRRCLGDVLQLSGKPAEAAESYREALALAPASLGTWFGLGRAERDAGRTAHALEAFDRGATLSPGHGPTTYMRGITLFDLGLVEDAVKVLRTAADMTGLTRAAALESLAVLAPGIPGGGDELVLRDRLAWAREIYPEGAPPRGPRLSPANEPLRIGYVSSFFECRNWMKPVWAMLRHQDRERFRVHIYSDEPMEKMEPGYEHHPGDVFRYTGRLDVEQMARRVAEDELDLVVDLDAYSRQRRLGIWPKRMAPVQIAWFNMYGTSGLPGIDILVGDDVAAPPGTEEHCSEQLERLDCSYITFGVSYPVPDVVPPPCTRGRPFTFGCLASLYKFTDEVLDTWAKILTRAPDSRFYVKNGGLDDDAVKDHFLRRLEARGITRDRVRLGGREEHARFIRAYDDIDVALDPFPYNGGTTTTEAVWQGVPLLSFTGERWSSRTSATLLTFGGLTEFLADDRAAHVEQAVSLATDPDARDLLTTWRKDQRERLAASRVCDAAALARGLEAVYERALAT